MAIVVKHAKTNTVPAWTQTDLDNAIAGQPPAIPAGTLIDGFTTTGDWNDDHVIVGLDDEYARLDGTNQPFTGTVQAPEVIVSSLTPTRIVYVDSNDSLTDSANLTFDGNRTITFGDTNNLASIGKNNTFTNGAAGSNSFMAGNGNTLTLTGTANSAVVLGVNNIVTSPNGAPNLTAIGFNNTVSDLEAVAIGGNNTSSTVSAVSIGSGNNTRGIGSASIGLYCATSTINSYGFAFGAYSEANGVGAFAGGVGAFATATNSGIFGYAPVSYSVTNSTANSLMVAYESTNLLLTATGITSNASLNLRTGTATANTYPLKFTSGALLTTPVVGVEEFLTDKRYTTITTGTSRVEYTLNNIALTSGRVPFATTNGRLTDDAAMTFASATLTVTNVTSSGLSTAGGFSPTATTATGNRMYLPAANTIGWSINGTGEIQLTSTALSPIANDGNALGTTALMWSDLFLASGGVINFNNGNATLTHSAGVITSNAQLSVSSINGFVNTTSVVNLGNANTVVAGTNRITMGILNSASVDGATAIGRSNTASGIFAVALGFSNSGSGVNIGLSNTASGTAIGTQNSGAGLSIGRGNAVAADSIAMGDNNIITNIFCCALGNYNEVTAQGGTAIGLSNFATGSSVTVAATAIGFGVTASGTDSLSIGTLAVASATNSAIVGYSLTGVTNSTANSMMLAYEGTNFLLDANRITANKPVKLLSYTVAGLPTGAAGDTAFVTNALAPTFGAAVTGGGAVGVPVYHDGTSWKVG